MRPAHCAREVLVESQTAGVATVASMRPAHCAREVMAHGSCGVRPYPASMRPAHCAREVLGLCRVFTGLMGLQ